MLPTTPQKYFGEAEGRGRFCTMDGVRAYGDSSGTVAGGCYSEYLYSPQRSDGLWVPIRNAL